MQKRELNINAAKRITCKLGEVAEMVTITSKLVSTDLTNGQSSKQQRRHFENIRKKCIETCRPVHNDNGTWRSRMNFELCNLIQEADS